MTRRGRIILVAGLAVAGLAAIALIIGMDPGSAPRSSTTTPPATATGPATAHITATVFYGSSDGQGLVPVRVEVPLAEGVVAQGARILAAQFGPAPAPYVSVIPKGTTLRSFYVTGRGDAFVDLSREITTAHPGGSLTELLTVYAIVDAVTANLPAVQRVQLLVEGKEVDTIAGHIDVRRPLTRDQTLVRTEAAK